MTLLTYLLTYVRSEALPEKLPVVQPFRKFPAILRNPKVHHRVHKSPPPVLILSQSNPVPTIPSYLSKIHFNIVHPPTSWSSQWSVSMTFPCLIKLNTFFRIGQGTCPIRAFCESQGYTSFGRVGRVCVADVWTSYCRDLSAKTWLLFSAWKFNAVSAHASWSDIVTKWSISWGGCLIEQGSRQRRESGSH
jgi:hypothetical protein